MSYLDQIARAGGQGDGGPPLSTLGFAPTGRASCKGCGGAIPKGGLRATKFVRSAHHDGYDAAHYHAECLKSPPRGFDPRCVLALPWRDQLAFSGDDAQKDALRGNPDAQRASELLSETRKALANDVKPKDVKQLCEENGYALVSGPKPIPLDTLLDVAADGLCFGRLAKCGACGSRALRHAGAGQGGHALTWCTGWASASTACAFVSRDPPPRESKAWEGSAALRKGKARAALAALLEDADDRAGRGAPDPAAASPPPKKKARTSAAAAPPPPPSPKLKAVPPDSRLLVVDSLALQEAGASGAAGGRVSVVVTHGGRTAMNVQLVLVDSAHEANKFYRLQCLNFGERYAVFSRWGRVGQDDGRGVYSAYGGSRANKCMLHFHPTLADAQQEFSHYFSRHTLNDWPVFAATRAFEQKPGCYDVVRHADAELAGDDDGPAAPAVSRPAADLGGLGIKELKRLAAERGVDVSTCFEKRDLVAAVAAALPAAPAAAPPPASLAPLETSVEAFVRCIMDKKNLEDDLSKRDVDVTKFPLGEISLACVKRAYAALSAASAAVERAEATDAARQSDVDRARDAAAVTSATNDFLRAIPHKVGRGAMAALRLDSRAVIQEKLDLVAALEQVLVRLRLDRSGAAPAAPAADPRDEARRQYDCLGCELTPVGRGTRAYAEIAAYLARGWPRARLDALFEARIPKQEAAFAPHRTDDCRLLWHGSSLANWCGILNGGLRIAPPEAPANGYNFDKGLYFADYASKSAQYCRADDGAPAVLCLAEVAVGRQHRVTAPDVNANNTRRLNSKDSVFAQGRLVPDPAAGDLDHGGAKIPLGAPVAFEPPADAPPQQRFMGHNELIVYEEARHKIRYVLQVRAGPRGP